MGGDYRRSYRNRSRSPAPSRSLTASSRKDSERDGRRMPDNRREGQSYRGRDHHESSRGREAFSKKGHGSGQNLQALGHDAWRQGKSPEEQYKNRIESSTSTTIDVSNVDPDDEESIMKAMGFGGFDSTKGKHVPGNIHEAVDKRKKLEYRQYLHKKKLYDVPLTRQQLEEREHQAASTNKEDS